MRFFYVLRTGCQWQALPKNFPPKSTVHWYSVLWDLDSILQRIHHAHAIRLHRWPLVASNSNYFVLSAFILTMKLLPRGDKNAVADTFASRQKTRKKAQDLNGRARSGDLPGPTFTVGCRVTAIRQSRGAGAPGRPGLRAAQAQSSARPTDRLLRRRPDQFE
jgi:hypothetical protein